MADTMRRGFRVRSAAAVLAAGLLTGCGDTDNEDGEQEDVSPNASETEADDGQAAEEPLAPDEEEVLAAYDGYWREYAAAVSEERLDAYIQAIDDDTVGQTALADYTALAAQQQVLEHVLNLDEGGRYMSGEPERLDPAASVGDLDAEVPTAEVTDCLNVADWLVWDNNGDQLELPEERSVQYTLTAELEQWEGTWRVTSATPNENSSC